MSQPPAYERYTNFTNIQATAPSTPLPAASVDAELNRIKTTLDAILTNLELIQRDDGELANATVGFDQLTAAAVAAIPDTVPWVTATAYAVGDIVFESATVYYCAIAHTSGTFSTDLAAVKWVSIGSVGGAVTSVFSRSGTVVAATSDYDAIQVDFTPAGTIAATNVQAAIEEVSGDVTALTAATQPLDGDLTTIAGLTATTDNILQSVAGAWASRTPTQVLATMLTGAANDDVIQRKGGVWTYRTVAQLVTDLNASGGQPATVLLEAADFTSVADLTIALDAYSTYKSFDLVIHRIVPATDDADLYLTVSSDSGSTFLSADYQWIEGGSENDNKADPARSEAQAQWNLWSFGIGNAAAEGMSGTVRLYRPLATTFKAVASWEFMVIAPDGNLEMNRGGGSINAAGDITDIKLAFSTGNIAASGSYSLIGIR